MRSAWRIRLIISPLLLNRRSFRHRKLLGRYGVELELDVNIYVFKNCVEVLQSHKGSPGHSFDGDAVEKNIDELFRGHQGRKSEETVNNQEDRSTKTQASNQKQNELRVFGWVFEGYWFVDLCLNQALDVNHYAENHAWDEEQPRI